MKRKKDAAAEITHTAADIKDAIIEKVGPLVDQAGDLFEAAQDNIAPLARDAKVKSAKFAVTAVDKAAPAIDDALDKVSPAVDNARDRIQKDLLPKLTDLLRQAAELQEPTKKELKQMRKEAKRTGDKALIRTLAKYGVVEKRNTGKKVGFVAAVTALIGAAVVLLRRYLGQTDESGWAAHEPSAAYTDKKESANDFIQDKADDARRAFSDAAETVKDTASDAAHAAGSTLHRAADKAGDVADDAARKAGQVADDAARKADEAADVVGEAVKPEYGEGSFVGNEPPEGFVIKGNERSMKYHVSGNEGYDRTIADVWFNSEDAAERHGFSRAMR